MSENKHKSRGKGGDLRWDVCVLSRLHYGSAEYKRACARAFYGRKEWPQESVKARGEGIVIRHSFMRARCAVVDRVTGCSLSRGFCHLSFSYGWVRPFMGPGYRSLRITVTPSNNGNRYTETNSETGARAPVQGCHEEEPSKMHELHWGRTVKRTRETFPGNGVLQQDAAPGKKASKFHFQMSDRAHFTLICFSYI